MTKIHELKTEPKYFDDIVSGKKVFEARKNDRNFKKGDILHLRKFSQSLAYYPEDVLVRVTYILNGGQFGIEEGYCVMGIKVLK